MYRKNKILEKYICLNINTYGYQNLVATHKDYFMPHDDGLYLPIKVGNALSRLEGRFQGDDTGENISEKIRIIAN